MIKLLIHGGAGNFQASKLSAEVKQLRLKVLNNALSNGYTILAHGGTAVDAAEEAVRTLEDSPLFNAGKGSVYNDSGSIEMDASIMNGGTLAAGGVAGVQQIKNPISAARLVMEKTKYVLLCGRQAEHQLKALGLETVDYSYFYSSERWKAWHIKGAIASAPILDHSDESQGSTDVGGTVGSVALDVHGNLAAATSTGGMANKAGGRIGDSAIIGSGTYASNDTCAVSTTGEGEAFMRAVSAYDIAARMRYSKATLEEAAQAAIDELHKLGGTGGLIALDSLGNSIMPFNSSGMYRGSIDAQGRASAAIF